MHACPRGMEAWHESMACLQCYLEHVLVRLTGRNYTLTPLYIGDIFAVRQSFGNRPDSSEARKIFVSGQLISLASSFKRIGGMPSGLGDLSFLGILKSFLRHHM